MRLNLSLDSSVFWILLAVKERFSCACGALLVDFGVMSLVMLDILL